jgi:hypothetical protein
MGRARAGPGAARQGTHAGRQGRAWQHILRDAGEDALAAQLRPDDLAELRALRDEIKPVFAAGSAF